MRRLTKSLPIQCELPGSSLEDAVKICTRCKIQKPVSEFYWSKRNGFEGRCKPCKSELAAIHYAANKQRIIAQQLGYYHANKERLLPVRKEQRSSPERKQALADYQREYLSCPEKKARHAGYTRVWRKRNPILAKALGALKERQRRARQAKAAVVLTPQELKQVELVYLNAANLSTLGVKHHVDHIHPVSKGGTDHPDNLQVLTQTANAMKSARSMADCVRLGI